MDPRPVEIEYLQKKYFPKRHPEDDAYQGHCVRCGSVIWSASTTWVRFRAAQWDGHRNNPGDRQIICRHSLIFGSDHCKECYHIVKEKILRALAQTDTNFVEK